MISFETFIYGVFLRNLDIGFYVDIGCNLPKSRSLTYLLYKKKWRGIKNLKSKRKQRKTKKNILCFVTVRKVFRKFCRGLGAHFFK